uniref:ATP-dependent DNA helicase n=1 Tax=Macrostomum lignano TaxID=282301 RepID=A0A1I8G2F6_9PLAT
LCRQDAVARGLLYQEVPPDFTWDRSAHQWHRAGRGRVAADQPAGVLTTGNIGRVYTVSPRMGDCFYLRLLLVNVRGPTSFEALRTVDGVLLPTFKAACQARGLLEDDRHWRLCLCEASETRLPAALRRLFAAILSHGDSSDPAKLWQEFSGELAGDLLHQGYSPEAAESEVLRELQKLLDTMGGAELPAYGLPEPHVQPDQVGNGELPEDEEGMVSLPSEILMPDDTTTEQLIQHVYQSFEPSPDRDQMFAERSILSPLNKTVDEANAACLALFPGESRVYLSVDSIPNDDTAATNFPPELLNRLDPNGLPHHRLELKVGMPVMMTRNLDPPLLCNGTRLLLRELRDNVLLAEVATGVYRGRQVFIPRIPQEPSPTELPFTFRRLQFPIRLCFAMTIHRSQGQTLSTYAVDLATACFQHGQLYVALSRARSADGVQ